jgi:hypothetical protein
LLSLIYNYNSILYHSLFFIWLSVFNFNDNTMTQTFGRNLLDQVMDQTIKTLELEAETKTGTDADSKAEDIEVTGSTETTDTSVNANAKAAGLRYSIW